MTTRSVRIGIECQKKHALDADGRAADFLSQKLAVVEEEKEHKDLLEQSKRMISELEQRLAAMELQLQNQMAPHPQELEALQSVDTLLADCRELLATSAPEMDQAA